MSSEQIGGPEAIPKDLRHLIHLNMAYRVVSCPECGEMVAHPYRINSGGGGLGVRFLTPQIVPR